MEHPLLDFAGDDAHAGFRLERFEFFNWGTFDQHIWSITPQADNALLNGDIGSGKSTIVDALTTLLVPGKRITYNKAAGAESRERSLRSYVQGYYKSEKDDDRLSAKAVGLRDHRQYSVLLAHFINRGYGLCVTLAQVFWTRDGKTQPERFYLVSDDDLSIKAHFGPFGGEIHQLKRRLRKTPSVELFDSFTQYAATFRRKLGITNSKAMDLFYQTVSMKSVGNLTEFVRNHMLEPGDFDEKIQEICRNFENLSNAHEAVLKAKQQIVMLEPMVENGRQHELTRSKQAHLSACRDALYAYFAGYKAQLLRARIEKRGRELARLKDRLNQQKALLTHLRDQASTLRQSIDQSGGLRLGEIAREVRRLTDRRERRQKIGEKYATLCAALQLPTAVDDGQFYDNRQKTQDDLGGLESQKKSLEDQRVDAQIALRERDKQHRELAGEIESLAARQSNIPRRTLDLRREMCQTLGLREEDLPFVGELLQIRADQYPWQGAAERLLYTFGLSLIAPDASYGQVSRYVDRTHLRGRLVYYRVRETQSVDRLPVGGGDLLWRKLEIKPDGVHTAWLKGQLARRFDYTCCDDLETFHRLPKAVTAQGQIKSGGERHEKDDRHRIDDPARYVLGWSNQQKIAALKQEQTRLDAEGQKYLDLTRRLQDRLAALELQRDAMRDLLAIEQFSDIHWRTLAAQIDALETERKEIEASSDILQTLRQQLREVEEQITVAQGKEEVLRDDRAKAQAGIEHDEADLATATQTLDELQDSQRDSLFPPLQEMQAQALGDKALTLLNVDTNQIRMRAWVQDQIDACVKRLERLRDKVIRQMQAFKNTYPLPTREVDAALDAFDEYCGMLHTLVEQDLPRHEACFKELLNEGTIQEIALLQNQLQKESRDIQEKVGEINSSLLQIDYNPGSYIRLGSDRSPDQEVRAFQADLRICLGDTLGGAADEIYTEKKFLQVKALIERFKGRKDLAELDRRWTQKVTDVRNWREFYASERWREDDSEREFYSDSAGKSGGQKEKLAYTILASALAYQFGLKMGEIRSRSFRFVMIDEAFGRGSDESTRYGLEVFKKLNLQLLIITPLQKIHVIEDYVQTVHFVHNQDGERSQLRNLSIAEYQEEKRRRATPPPDEGREP